MERMPRENTLRLDLGLQSLPAFPADPVVPSASAWEVSLLILLCHCPSVRENHHLKLASLSSLLVWMSRLPKAGWLWTARRASLRIDRPTRCSCEHYGCTKIVREENVSQEELSDTDSCDTSPGTRSETDLNGKPSYNILLLKTVSANTTLAKRRRGRRLCLWLHDLLALGRGCVPLSFRPEHSRKPLHAILSTKGLVPLCRGANSCDARCYRDG